MFLSRLTLHPDASAQDAYWELLGSTYRLHREAWRVLGGGPDSKRDFLFRLDREGSRPVLYGLGPRPARDPRGIWNAVSRPFEPVLKTGALLGFLVRVNPVRSRDGKRHDVVMDAKRRGAGRNKASEVSRADLVQNEVTGWLSERAERLGFALEHSQADGHSVECFSRDRGGMPIHVASCDVHGVLRVREPGVFVTSVLGGIGHAKAFGCGLMLLKRH